MVFNEMALTSTYDMKRLRSWTDFLHLARAPSPMQRRQEMFKKSVPNKDAGFRILAEVSVVASGFKKALCFASPHWCRKRYRLSRISFRLMGHMVLMFAILGRKDCKFLIVQRAMRATEGSERTTQKISFSDILRNVHWCTFAVIRTLHCEQSFREKF